MVILLYTTLPQPGSFTIQEQLFSLPITTQEVERRNESIPLLKGKFWQKKDRIFSRWKERFFILTAKCLDCYEKCPLRNVQAPLFKVCPSSFSVQFIDLQVKLSSIASMDLTEKKGYLTISLTMHKESNILLRSTSGIQELFHVIMVGWSFCRQISIFHHRVVARKKWRKAVKTSGQHEDRWSLV